MYDSFILYWEHKNNSLIIKLDVSIWSQSQYYVKPMKNEYTCYKKGVLIFSNIEKLTGLKKINLVKSTTDFDNEIDYGEIEFLEITEEGFQIIAEFGNVIITGGSLNLLVNEV